MSAGSTTSTTRWRPPPQGAWTYEDYLHLPDNGYRYEILGGDVVMSPAPSPRHQNAVAAILVALRTFLKERALGKAFVSPIDVRLSNNTVVQPDVIVLLNEHLPRILDNRIEGAPDLAVEVLSPSTESRDRRRKLDIYFEMGVREYWIVDLENQAVEVYVMRGEAITPFDPFRPGDTLQSELLPGFALDVAEIFTL